MFREERSGGKSQYSRQIARKLKSPSVPNESSRSLYQCLRNSSANSIDLCDLTGEASSLQRHSSMPTEDFCLQNSSCDLHTDLTESVPKRGKVVNSISYMSRLSSSFLGLASSVTDGYMSGRGTRRTSILSNSYSSSVVPQSPENIPTFVIPKWSAPPRDERLTSKAELLNFLKNNNPKGCHAALVTDMEEEKLNSNEELYRKKIREQLVPIDFVEVNNLGQSEQLCNVFEF